MAGRRGICAVYYDNYEEASLMMRFKKIVPSVTLTVAELLAKQAAELRAL